MADDIKNWSDIITLAPADDNAVAEVCRNCIICDKRIMLSNPSSMQMICKDCLVALRKLINQVNGEVK